MERTLIRASYLATCGIGWYSADLANELRAGRVAPERVAEQSDVHYVGTGFLVSPRLVMTAHHVKQSMASKGIPVENMFAAFAKFPDESASTTLHPIQTTFSAPLALNDGDVIPPGAPRTDFGLLGLYAPVDNVKPLMFADPMKAHVGDEVAVYGYYRGNEGLFQDVYAVRRRGPLALFGRIAGITRLNDEAGNLFTLDIVLDVTASAGLSGGPVVDDAGRIVGLLTAGFESRPLVQTYPHGQRGEPVFHALKIPHGVARVLPVDHRWKDLILEIEAYVENLRR